MYFVLDLHSPCFMSLNHLLTKSVQLHMLPGLCHASYSWLFPGLLHPHCSHSEAKKGRSLWILHPHFPQALGGNGRRRKGLTHSCLGPHRAQGRPCLPETVGVRSTICLITEEPVVSGWNLSLDTFILTCSALGKPSK